MNLTEVVGVQRLLVRELLMILVLVARVRKPLVLWFQILVEGETLS